MKSKEAISREQADLFVRQLNQYFSMDDFTYNNLVTAMRKGEYDRVIKSIMNMSIQDIIRKIQVEHFKHLLENQREMEKFDD